MKIALLALLLAPLASCLAGPPFEAGPPAPAPEPTASAQPPSVSPSPPSPSLRLVAVDAGGDLCVLDPDSGELRSRQSVGAVDALATRSGPPGLVTVEPSDDGTGRLGRYELRGDRLGLAQVIAFDAPSGRLLDAAEAVVGLSLDEGTSLFRATDSQGVGAAWSPVVTAASRVAGHELRLITVGVPDSGKVELRQAIVSEQGVQPGNRFEVEAGEDCVPAVFSDGDGFGWVEARGGALRVRRDGSPLDGAEAQVPGACAREAAWLGEPLGLAVLAGSSLVLMRPGEVRSVDLGAADEASTRLTHRMALDAGRGRLWVAAAGRLRAVDLATASVVAEGGCEAVAVAAVEAR